MIGSKLRIRSYPLLASLKHVGATSAVSILRVVFSCELSNYSYTWVAKMFLISNKHN